MSLNETELSARMSAARVTELGIPGSVLYTKLDAALAEKLQKRATANSILHAKRDSMLIVDAASDDMLRIIDDLFPKYNRVMYTLYTTFASDIEALRSAVYTALFDDILTEGEIIHVGGFQDTHAVHGRHVHCEQVTKGPMEYGRAMRRFQVREQLYRNATAVKTCMGDSSKLPWALKPVLGDADHGCVDPTTCSRVASYMVFDINVVPMSQQQACAAMVQHSCEVAQALVLVEDNSLIGSCGYITGSKVRAEYDSSDGLIHYYADAGGVPEFPPINRSVLLEWVTTTAMHWFGCTFFFEVVQHYGPFVKIQITRVPEIIPVELTHRVWDLNATREASTMRVVSVPKLVDLNANPNDSANYSVSKVVVPEKLYKSVHQYALTLSANDFRRANLRRKLNEMNNRVIVKGTAVEIVEPLHPEVADVVATELFIKTYIERFDTSQTFKMVTAKMSAVRSIAGKGDNILARALCKTMYKVQDWWADSVTDGLRAYLDKVIGDRTLMLKACSELERGYSEHTTLVRGGKGDYGLKAAVSGVGGYLLMLLRNVSKPTAASVGDGDGDGSSIYERFASVSGSDTGRSAAHVCDDREVPVEVYHCREYRQAGLISDDSLYDDVVERNVVETGVGVKTVLDECHLRADTGADGQQAVIYSQRVELIVDMDDSYQHGRARVDVPDFLNVICDQYQATFPAVAAADMSADYELAAHGLMAYTVNVPFLRMPLDNIVGSMRMVYQSKLNGPNRPNAPSETRNLLTGVVKRNADPNVIKRPQDYDISRQMWENFLDKRCKPEARELLLEYQRQPIQVSMPNVARWAVRVGADKVAKVIKLFEDHGEMMTEYLLNEFLLQFKGKVKPTLSRNAHATFAKFQTIMHYTTEVNMFWSAMFSDLTARYNAMLSPHIHVGVRGNDIDKRDHIRIHHPWGDSNLVYVQLDMSEYDKSQDIRAREFFDIMHKELGMSDEYVKMWSDGQRDNVARSMALGMKLIVPLQMKSGIGTTLWGNSAYSQAIAAWLMPDVTYELGQGDDLYDVLPEAAFDANNLADKAAAVFNMPLKLICQRLMPMRTGYFCGKFVVYDNMRKEVFMLPDPIKAIESLSRPITEDEAKFDEMYVSFMDRMVAWQADFPTATFDHMVSRWYEAPDLRATYVVDAMISAGASKETFRSLWEDYLVAVK